MPCLALSYCTLSRIMPRLALSYCTLSRIMPCLALSYCTLSRIMPCFALSYCTLSRIMPCLALSYCTLSRIMPCLALSYCTCMQQTSTVASTCLHSLTRRVPITSVHSPRSMFATISVSCLVSTQRERESPPATTCLRVTGMRAVSW